MNAAETAQAQVGVVERYFDELAARGEFLAPAVPAGVVDGRGAFAAAAAATHDVQRGGEALAA
jgi:hypothetical protein